MSEIAFSVNGKAETLSVDDSNMPLLYALRDDLALRGPRFGCGLGQCGACEVLVDGRVVRSCRMPVSQVANKAVVTLEGLGDPDKPSKVQAAFIAEQAAQCGYCTNGMIMGATALLARNPQPTEADIRDALAHTLCRCGSHARVVAAVLRAAREG